MPEFTDSNPAPETTSAEPFGQRVKDEAETVAKRVREVIAYPSRHADGTVTHQEDAEIHYDPAEIPAAVVPPYDQAADVDSSQTVDVAPPAETAAVGVSAEELKPDEPVADPPAATI